MILKVIAVIFLFFSNFRCEILESSCYITNALISENRWIKTIGIIKFENNFQSDIVGDYRKCLPEDISTILMDLKWTEIENVKNWNIFNPSLIVIVADHITYVST